MAADSHLLCLRKTTERSRLGRLLENEPNDGGLFGNDTAGKQPESTVEATDPWQQAIEEGRGFLHPWDNGPWHDRNPCRGWTEWHDADRDGQASWSQGNWDSVATLAASSFVTFTRRKSRGRVLWGTMAPQMAT